MNTSSSRTAISLARQPRGRITAILLAGAALAGCSDPALEQQAKFDREFRAVAASYASTLGGNLPLLSNSPPADSLTALRALAEQAKGLDGGTAAQREAATQLASSIYRTAGGLELARALRIEADQELARAFALEAAGLADHLDAISTALSQLDFSAARAAPDALRKAGQPTQRAAKELVQSIEKPLADLTARIAADTQQVDRLAGEIAVKLRSAREAGPTEALRLVEEAAQVEAQSREIRTLMFDAESGAMSMESDLTIAKVRLSAEDGLLSAANAALDFVTAFEADVDGQAERTKALATELRKTAEGLMKTIADERAGALRGAYEAATADLANAASTAGSGTAADALRRAIACDELRLRTSEVNGIGAQARLAATLGSTEVEGLKTSAESALQSLREKANAASELMAPFADDPAMGGLKNLVDQAKKRADALTTDKLLNPPSAPKAEPKQASRQKGSGASSSGRSMSSEDSASDIEAWVASFNAAVDSSPSKAIEMLVDSMDDSTSGAKAIKDMSAPMLTALSPLLDAMQSKFGSAKLDLGRGMARGMGAGLGSAGVSKLEKVALEDDRAVFKDTDGTEFVFVKSGSGWKLNMSAALEAQGMTEEQVEQMLPMMQAMIGPMMTAMKKAAVDTAAKIESGEITSPEAAGAAMQAALQQAMSGMLGGGRRGGPGSGQN